MIHPFFSMARDEATELLQRLDERFEPRVYALFFDADKPDTFTAAPEDFPFSPDDFYGVITRAKEIQAADPEIHSRWMPSPRLGWTEAHQHMQDAKERGIWCRALCQAVTEAANAAKANEGYVSYCWWPVKKDGQDAFVFLQVQKDVHDSYHNLTRGTYQVGMHNYRRERSLIDAVIREYLSEASKDLAKESPGAGNSVLGSPDHIFARAGKALMRTPAIAGGNDNGPNALFDACHELSLLKYESEEGVGSIVFARPDHPHVRTDIAFNKPTSIRSLLSLRKMLQLASGHLSLLCDACDVYGLGRILDTYDLSGEDVFKVNFTEQLHWDLRHGNHVLMTVKYGQPSLRRPGFPAARFRRDLPRIIPSVVQEKIGPLLEIAETAAAQKHGCMIVITSAAKEEAERLEAQCTRVQPFLLTKDVIPLVTSIDGSVLIDTDGICHAIGVILDGMASTKCSPERGSRYNSAIRYAYGGTQRIAMVKSEDGMVSVLPDLMPQIRRSDIIKRIAELRAIANTDPIDRDVLWPLTDWFRKHEFYLTPQECDEINQHRKTITDILSKDGQLAITETYSPNPEMNDSYYLDE